MMWKTINKKEKKEIVCEHVYICGQKSLWKIPPRNVYFWNIMIEIWCYHNFLDVEIQGLTKSCWNLPKRPLFILYHKMYFASDTCQVSGDVYLNFPRHHWAGLCPQGLSPAKGQSESYCLGKALILKRSQTMYMQWSPKSHQSNGFFLWKSEMNGGPKDNEKKIFSVLLSGDRIFWLVSWSKNRGQYCVSKTLTQSFWPGIRAETLWAEGNLGWNEWSLLRID